MLEEAKIVSFDVGLRVYTRTRTKERERERFREREREIQREKDSERNGAKERRRRTSRLSLWPMLFRSGLCKKRSGNFRFELKVRKKQR